MQPAPKKPGIIKTLDALDYSPIAPRLGVGALEGRPVLRYAETNKRPHFFFSGGFIPAKISRILEQQSRKNHEKSQA